MKKEVLQTSFRASVDSLIKRIKKQKDIITSSYGPIVLNSKKIERPIFDINKELDPEGHAIMKKLNAQQDEIPQTILVKLRTVRCLKDKISSGHYLLLVHPLDRLGGNRIQQPPALTHEKYLTLSKHLREFAVRKRQFLNSENRQVVQQRSDGSAQYVSATATGAHFFKPDDPEEGDAKIVDRSGDLEASMVMIDKPIDYQKDVEIDLERSYSRYVRFNARHQDDNLDIEDVVSVMISPDLESTNCLQFQLVLLESDIVPRDYVVGWGVFPLLNSDFQLNEGKFKVPLLFGQVKTDFDKFKKIETEMMTNLDNWVSNLYFEIEKVNLMDIKVDEDKKKLYYSPVSGVTPQEQQQLLKMHQDEDEEPAPEEADYPEAQSPALPPGGSQYNLNGSVLNASQHMGASAV